LKNAKELVAEFEERVKAEVRRQEKLDQVEERDFRRGGLLERYIARILYKWDDGNYKRNSTESLLLQSILFILIYYGSYSILGTLL